MTKAKADRLGADYKQGPNPGPGGVIDTGESLVPPYDGRTGGSDHNEATRASVSRALAGAKGGVKGQTGSAKTPPRSSAKTGPRATAKGVESKSSGRAGEAAAGRSKEKGRVALKDDSKGSKTKRPVGRSTTRDTSSVNSSEPLTDSPPMGGQGG